jgi:S1-C subfamily serine protease
MKRRKWSLNANKSYPVKSSLHPYNFFVPLVEQVKDGVVSIVTEDRPSDSNIDKLLREFFVNQLPFEQHADRSFGSGFIFHRDGYILTSEHVVGKSKSILVKHYNGRVYEAERVLTDHARDFAVLKIKPIGKLRPLPIGDSSETKVGEWVLSIGSPTGCIGIKCPFVRARSGLFASTLAPSGSHIARAA